MKIYGLFQLEKAFNKSIKRPILRFFEKKMNTFAIHRFRLLTLKKFKYIHVMNNGIHSIATIKFIQKHFNNNDHAFIFPILKDETKPKLVGLPNVFKYSIEDIPLDYVNKIIFHGLFTIPFIQFLYKNPKFLEKSYWFIWGGDLYNAKDTKESSFVKKKFAGILTTFDYDKYKSLFGENKCFDVSYGHDPVELSATRQVKRKSSPVSILINNCADESTIEMLDILKKFKNYNIKIYTILSYITVNQKDPRLNIMKKGYETFGNKFVPILDYMDKPTYIKFLSTIDIYISNQDRQQGNGNASVICSLGGKVFTKSESSVYKKYNSLGIKYFNTYDIQNLSFKQFVSYDDQIKNETMTKIKTRMADSTKVKQWNDFFLSK